MGKIKSDSPFVDGVMEYYASGHSIKNTASYFDVTVNQVNYWAKVRHISNGRDAAEILRECNLKRALGEMPNNVAQVEAAKERWEIRLSECGIILIEYRGKGKKLTLKCSICGEIFERGASTDLFKKGATCPNCKAIEAEEKRLLKDIEQQEKKKQKEAEKQAANPLGLSAYQLEREKVLDVPHICKVCGAEYTIRSYMKNAGVKYKRDSGFCSKQCRDKHKKQQAKVTRKKNHTHCGKHYSRARKLNLPRERGITLKKLIDKNGLTCAICGLPCFYEGDGKGDLYPSIDHIIPMNKGGGHTWDNVQIAHRLCNSNKRDYIGEEWHNGTT